MPQGLVQAEVRVCLTKRLMHKMIHLISQRGLAFCRPGSTNGSKQKAYLGNTSRNLDASQSRKDCISSRYMKSPREEDDRYMARSIGRTTESGLGMLKNEGHEGDFFSILSSVSSIAKSFAPEVVRV